MKMRGCLLEAQNCVSGFDSGCNEMFSFYNSSNALERKLKQKEESQHPTWCPFNISGVPFFNKRFPYN